MRPVVANAEYVLRGVQLTLKATGRVTGMTGMPCIVYSMGSGVAPAAGRELEMEGTGSQWPVRCNLGWSRLQPERSSDPDCRDFTYRSLF